MHEIHIYYNRERINQAGRVAGVSSKPGSIKRKTSKANVDSQNQKKKRKKKSPSRIQGAMFGGTAL